MTQFHSQVFGASPLLQEQSARVSPLAAREDFSLDIMPIACHKHAMANVQMKNVPEELHRRLQQLAKEKGVTMRDLLLDAARRELEREEFLLRLREASPVVLAGSAAELIEQERAERDAEVGP